MNRRGSPPPKLSPFFPFFLSLLSSKKKRATTSRRETTEEVRSRRASRARDPTATHTRARVVFLRQRRRCSILLILDGVKPNFFCRFCRSRDTPSLSFFVEHRDKKKGRFLFHALFFGRRRTKTTKQKRRLLFVCPFPPVGRPFVSFSSLFSLFFVKTQ